MRQPPGWGVSANGMGGAFSDPPARGARGDLCRPLGTGVGTTRRVSSEERVMARRWGIGAICVLVMACAPAAQAAVRADVAAKERLAKFTLKRLGATPATIRAGSSFRVRGRVANAKRRRAQ